MLRRYESVTEGQTDRYGQEVKGSKSQGPDDVDQAVRLAGRRAVKEERIK